MGLNHPVDLAAWQRWQAGRRPWPTRVKGDLLARAGRLPQVVLTTGGEHPRILIALDAVKSTTIAAQLAPLQHLDLTEVAILSPSTVTSLLPEHPWAEQTGRLDHLARQVCHSQTVILSTGHYLAVGAFTRSLLTDPTRFVTVQHGLLTPHAPPLAADTTVLAWSGADGEFWRSGRGDGEIRLVGSQLLWDAGNSTPRGSAGDLSSVAPVYLGQLHGSELPRAVLESAAHDFCLSNQASYRPHPSETDRASLARHQSWAADGIRIDRSGTALTDLRAPIVSVYSTGLLEAAARGLPAWAHLPLPPSWLTEFWSRYGIALWGDSPTAAPSRPDTEPAAAVAQALRDLVGDPS